ncbi:MAG: 6-phosphogluconate dehydrogenase [Bacteroidota bacterium]
MMKILKRTLIVVVALAICILSFLYWGSYEKGEMAGKVLRISEKGFVFKTYEGKLSLESFGALKGVSPVAETFDFSVESGEKDVLEQLNQVALSGERVSLHFTRRFMRFPWRGDTKYFITQVERSKP